MKNYTTRNNITLKLPKIKSKSLNYNPRKQKVNKKYHTITNQQQSQKSIEKIRNNCKSQLLSPIIKKQKQILQQYSSIDKKKLKSLEKVTINKIIIKKTPYIDFDGKTKYKTQYDSIQKIIQKPYKIIQLPQNKKKSQNQYKSIIKLKKYKVQQKKIRIQRSQNIELNKQKNQTKKDNDSKNIQQCKHIQNNNEKIKTQNIQKQSNISRVLWDYQCRKCEIWPIKKKAFICTQCQSYQLCQQCMIKQVHNHSMNQENATGVSVKISNKYIFDINQQPLGKGSFAKVYKGFEQNNFQVPLAIKIIQKSYQQMTKIQKQKIQLQASIIKNFHSTRGNPLKMHFIGVSKIPEVENLNQVKQRLCIVMEYLPFTVVDAVKVWNRQNGKRISQSRQAIAKKILFKVVSSYLLLYENNVIHKDLKPENILMENGGKGLMVKLTDFGISAHSVLQNLNESQGTLAYQSWQQRYGKQYTNKCDVFALGGLYIYLLIGETPMDAGILDYFTHQIDYKEMSKVLKNLSIQSFQFIKKCMTMKEKDRYSWEQIFIDKLFDSQKNQKEQIVWLLNLGDIYYENPKNIQRYNESIKCYEMAKTICQLKNDKHFVAICLNNIGRVYHAKKQLQKGIQCMQESLKIHKQVDGQFSYLCYLRYYNLGCLYKQYLNDPKKIRKAIQYIQKALEIIEKIGEQVQKQSAKIFNSLAQAYQAQGDDQKYLQYQERALKIAQKYYGDFPLQISLYYNNIAVAYSKDPNDIQKCLLSIQYLQKSLNILKNIKGEESLNVALVLHSLAFIYVMVQNYEKALFCQQRAYKIYKKLVGKISEQCAKGLIQIGNIVAYKNLQQSIKNIQQSIKIYKLMYQKDPQKLFKSIKQVTNLINQYNTNNIIQDKCLQLHYQALALIQKIKFQDQSKKKFELAIMYHKISIIYLIKQEKQNQKQFEDKANHIYFELKKTKSQQFVKILKNISQRYKVCEKYIKTVKYLKLALQALQITKQQNLKQKALILHQIAKNLRYTEQYLQGIQYQQNAIQIFKKLNQPLLQKQVISEFYKVLADIYLFSGQYVKSIQYYKLSLKNLENAIKKEKSFYIIIQSITILNCGLAYQLLGKHIQYQKYWQNLKIIVQKYPYCKKSQININIPMLKLKKISITNEIEQYFQDNEIKDTKRKQ